MITFKQAIANSEYLTRNLWRANLGLYGVTYDVAKAQYTKANRKVRTLLNECIKQGGQMEQKALKQVKSLSDDVRDKGFEFKEQSVGFIKSLSIKPAKSAAKPRARKVPTRKTA